MHPSATMTVLVFLAFLSSGCYASSCVNISSPNFFGGGECLNKSGDICSANTDGIVAFLLDLNRCFLEGLVNLDLGTQFYLLYNYLVYFIDVNDFGIVLPALKDLCKSFNAATGGLVTISCDALKFNTQALCGNQVFISVATSTPLATCLNDTGLTCEGNTVIDEPTTLGSLRIVVCLVSYALNTSPTDVGKQLICDIVTSFSRIFGPLGYIFFKPYLCALVKAFGVTCSGIRC